MQTASIAIPTAATSIYGLTGHTRASYIYLQCPSTNSGAVYWGDNSNQVNFIEAGNSSRIDIGNLKKIYIKGTDGDVAYLTIF